MEHTPKPMCEQEDVSVVELSSTHRQKSTANRPYTVLKNTKEKTCILMDGSTRRQKSHKRKQKKAIEEFMYTGAINVEQKIYDNTSNNWSR
jgi:hypothetical protein